MFRFTIRDLLWLTVAVAITTLWFIEHLALRKTTAEHESVKARLTAVEARLNAEWAARSNVDTVIGKAAYSHGFDKGVETERSAQASREEERRRSLQGILPSKKEAAPGIYFLQ